MIDDGSIKSRLVAAGDDTAAGSHLDRPVATGSRRMIAAGDITDVKMDPLGQQQLDQE